MKKHEDILPVCEERYVSKGNLLIMAWIVGVAFVGGLWAVGTYAINNQKEINISQSTRIEALEKSIPSIDAKLDILIEQGKKRERFNRIGVER